jgi:hypothetical protein
MTKEEAIDLVKKDLNALEHLDAHYKSDKDVVLTATSQNGNALQYASEELKNDREIVMAAVSINGNALQYAPEVFKNDREIVLAAVSSIYGDALQYASNGLKNDREIVFAAVRKSGYSLKYASDECKNDKEFIKRILAVNNASILDYIDGLWKDDADILSCINTTFNITTDLKTGQQIWESKELKLQVSISDFENKMDWDEAYFACRDLGEDWRLPSLCELDEMNKLLVSKRKFSTFPYWSCDDFDNLAYAWAFIFHGGSSQRSKGYTYNVFAVRNIK